MENKIPKIIHYSWFSNDPIPDFIQNLMATWIVFLPDYEFKLWDYESLKATQNKFANEAATHKKWAFAADYIRLYAVYTHGGIWFDTDIEVFKNLDDFLQYDMFIGREANTHGYNPMKTYLTAHVFGAKKGHTFLADCLEYYNTRTFVQAQSLELPLHFRYDIRILPEIMATIAERYNYKISNEAKDRQTLLHGIEVFPPDYFDCPRYLNMKNVHTIHRAAGAWRPSYNRKEPDFTSTNPLQKDRKYYFHKYINNLLKRVGFRLISYRK